MKIAPEDKKKVRALAILGVMLLGSMYYSFFYNSSGSSSIPTPAAVRPGAAPTAANSDADDTVTHGAVREQRAEEFHPVLRARRKEDRADPTKIDPRIQLFRLAKLQEVPPAGSGRNLFQFGAAPPPKVDPLPLKNEPKVAVLIGPPYVDLTPKPPPPKPPEPPPPPFTPKYYGLATTTASGRKRAFFLDGDDIIIRAEGETVKGHFKLLRIGQNSCVVEDSDSKKQQTIQIAEDAQG